MGYRRKKVLTLTEFSEGDMAGLEVCTRSPTIDTMVEVESFEGTAAQVTVFIRDKFAEHLESWNLEDDDGEPVPATIEQLRAQDHDFQRALFDAWMDAVNGVPAGPLEQPSPDGELFPEDSIPMETLSESQAS